MNYSDLTEKYFEAFSSMNIEKLDEYYDDEISLRDWEIDLKGKSSVLNANKLFFESINEIGIKIISIYQNQNTLAAEIEITIDNNEKLLVIDLISFKKKKIISIKAFKG